MSVSLLSRQVVERWLPEESAQSKGGVGAGFVAKLFTTINRAMASLVSLLPVTKDGEQQRYRNDFERFFLWGQGLSIMDGTLDEVLAHSKELHFQVLTLLLRLGTVVLQGLSKNSASLSQVLTEQCDDLQILLDTTEGMLQEQDPDEPARPNTPSESGSSDYEVADIVEEISVYVDCLLDLSPSLDNPALDIQVEGSDERSTQAKESFAVSSEEAMIYCRKIRDRFEVLPIYLVERLAEANVVRAAALREMRSRSIKLEAHINDDISENIFSTTDPRATETTKSTVPPSSVFSSVMASFSKRQKASFSDQVDVLDFDDGATFASFSTAASAISLGRPRVPPLPDIQGDGFNCPICFLHVTNVKTRKEWKKHVFDDIQPYVCTLEDCEHKPTMYNLSRVWVQHEVSHPSSASKPPVCSFCSAIYQDRGPAYYSHVSGHLREVSLSVLPQPTGDDDDDGFDTDDSPLISHVGSEQDRVNEDGMPTSGKFNEPAQRNPWDIAPSDSDSVRSYELLADNYGYRQRTSTAGSADLETKQESKSSPLDKEDALSTSVSASAATSASKAAAEIANISDDVDIDSILDRLVEVRGSRPGKQVHLLESEIRYLCTKAREIFMCQPILLELEAPVKVIGDIHGQYYDLLRTFEYGGFPPEANYVFLGNYVDRGKQSIETMCLILAYKIKYPENFFPMRGNHECAAVSRIEGFYDEVKRRYNIKMWKTFIDMFNCMPVAAIIDEKIFCMHGGLSPDLNSMEQIRRILRPIDIPDLGLLCDLLWSDPDKDITGWSENDRGKSFTFGPDVVSRFLQKHDMDLIVRGHQVVEDGYEFFSNRQLVTLWGAPNYLGEYDNAGAMMSIDDSLLCSFQIIKPAEKKQNRFGRR